MKQWYIYVACLDAYGDILLSCRVLSDLWSRVCLHPITNDQMGVSEQQHSLYRGSVKAHTRKHIHKHTAIQHMAWDSTCKHVQALPRRRRYTNIHPSNHGETKTSSNGVERDCWIWWFAAENWHVSHLPLQRISLVVYKVVRTIMSSKTDVYEIAYYDLNVLYIWI